MSNPEYARKVNEARSKLETAKKNYGINSNDKNIVRRKGNFERVKESAPNQVGVYTAEYNGRIMYVGRAIENRQNQSTKGLRKRLQEHWRGAASGKRELFLHRDELNINLHICDTVEEARALEALLIRKYDTVNNGWNLRNENY